MSTYKWKEQGRQTDPSSRQADKDRQTNKYKIDKETQIGKEADRQP